MLSGMVRFALSGDYCLKIQNDMTVLDMLGTPALQLSLENLKDATQCVALIAPSGRILTVSAATVAIMGLDNATQIIGRHWCKTWPSWTHAPLAEAMARGLRGDITTYWAQHPNQKGDMTDWDIRLSPVFGDCGTVTSVLAVSRPVTLH